MKMTLIPFVIGVLRIIPKWLIKGWEDLEIRGQVETIQRTSLSRSTRVLRRVLETCCHSNSSVKNSNSGVKNSQRNKMNRIILSEYIIILFTNNLLIMVSSVLFWYKEFSNWSISSIDWNLTVNANLDSSVLTCNGNEAPPLH